MSRRSRAREIALQALFQEDLNPQNSLENLGAFLAARLQEEAMRDFAKQLVLGVKRNQAELDQLLAEKASNWSVPRMAATDRNLLRLGAYELLAARLPRTSIVTATRRSSAAAHHARRWTLVPGADGRVALQAA